MKKILSVLLSLCLLAGMFPAVAQASGGNGLSLAPTQAENTFPQTEIYPADKSILADLVGSAENVDLTGYSPESIAVFQDALAHAYEILNTPLTWNQQAVVDEAVAQLVAAMDGLTAMPVEADKTLLEKTVAYALGLSTEGVIEVAKENFLDALTHAQAVLRDPYATQEEVNAAWEALLQGIWALGLTQGDKTELGQLVEQAQQMVEDQDKYVSEHWAQLVDALVAAQAVMDDPNAMEEDISPVADALLEAILAQRFKADKSILEDLIAQAEGIDLSGYTDESAAAFQEALDRAKEVMADETLSEEDQAVVDQAVKDLSQAMAALVRKVVVEDSTGDISVEDAQDSFTPGTTVSVEAVTEGDTYDRVETALEDVATTMDRVVIYEFTATLDGQAVQPQETVEVTLQIPDGFNPDYLKLYYVSETGEKVEIPITVNKETNTVTAYLPHFSTYVLVEVMPEPVTDKEELEQLIAVALEVVDNQALYVPTHWNTLLVALNEAQNVYDDPAATAQEVAQAGTALLEAILAQRFKADKSILEDLIAQAQAVDLTDCTQQQVAAFRAALAQAQAVLADNTLGRDDQAVVNGAVAALSAALENVTDTASQPEATDRPQTTQPPENTSSSGDTNVPHTGDTSALTLYVCILTMAMAGLSIVLIRKRKA